MKVGNSEWKQNDNGNDGPSVGSLQSLLSSSLLWPEAEGTRDLRTSSLITTRLIR